MDSNFIERFGIWGMAAMLGLMAVMGVYGFVSLMGVEPQEALLPPAEEVVSSEPDRRDSDDRIRPPRPTPAALAETAPPTATEDAAPPATPSSTPRAAVRAADAVARPGAAAAAAPPAAAATPAPSPAGVAGQPPPAAPPPATPVPTAPPETPAPTPPPPVCPEGAPELATENNNVRFTNATVVGFQSGQPGVLVVDVNGTQLAILVTDVTQVRGELGAATVVSGEAWVATEGLIFAVNVEAVCPESAR